jgi:superfamily II DNA or RNA helicase
VAHSIAIAEAFTEAGFKAVHVDGETPKEERRRAITDLGAGKLDLIPNWGLFSEGVDVPLLGLVVMLRPIQSLALYLQMVGRALRIGGAKRRALILDHAGNWERHGLGDFPHQWSLEGREKVNAGGLVRRCPESDAVIPIRAEHCPECGPGMCSSIDWRRRASRKPPRHARTGRRRPRALGAEPRRQPAL